MEIRTWAEISIQPETVLEPEAVVRNELNTDKTNAARYFIERMDFLRTWAAEYKEAAVYKGSSVNAD